MSAILREALVQDEPAEEPKTLLEIGVAVKRPITTRTTIITPTPIISHSQHLLHHLTSAPAPPATSSSHLQHHLSSQFTPIHQVHRPTGLHPHHHQHHWSESSATSSELVSAQGYPMHSSYPTNHLMGQNNGSTIINGNHPMSSRVHHEAMAGSGQATHSDRYGSSGVMVEHKTTRLSNTSWKDRAIQIERGKCGCCTKNKYILD